MKRLIQTTFMQHKKLRRRRQWNHFMVTLQTAWPSLRWQASSHWGSWRELSLQRPLQCNKHTWRKSLLMMKEGTDSEDPDGLDGMTEKFMVCLARAVKDVQQDKKHCYHCSSPDHFIRDCPLVKSARKEPNLNHKEGMVPKKRAQTPLGKAALPKALQDGTPKV